VNAPRHRIPPRAFHVRRGLTLTEMLVATALTVIVMAVVAQLFSVFGTSVSGSRSLTELSARMRTTSYRLRRDLEGATAALLPPLSPSDGEGYFEILEGPRHDRDAADGSDELRADDDDVLLFTTRDVRAPFTGRFPGGSIQGDTAEVAWFLRRTVPTTSPPTHTLYRRQLLVLGYVGKDPFHADGNRVAYGSFPDGYRSFFDQFDVSVARLGGDLVPNTLSDLTRRERRFLHNPAGDVTGSGFPYSFLPAHQIASTDPTSDTLPADAAGLIFDGRSSRRGEDIMLTNVVAFDVRVFDPAAPLAESAGTVVVPGDDVAIVPGPATGAYVDLGNGVNASADPLATGAGPRFAGHGHPSSRLVGSSSTRHTYDTWSTHYESNGLDEDAVAGVDQGSNDLDDEVPARVGGLVPLWPKDGIVDDAGERETSPPYPAPLRGIEIRLRCYEPTSRQLRQVTIRHTFLPH